jgi:RNA polymerase sigma-70 factor (ECF subfamily)
VTLDEAVEFLAPRLLRYCRAITSGQFSLAEEVAQESLAALVQRWRRYGPPDSPEAFVFAIARRRSRRAGWRQRLLLPLERLTNHRDRYSDPERQAIARQQCKEVFQALARLPRGEREALLLVVVGELDHDTAARALGISRAAVKMRVMRAKRRLAGLVEHDDGG